MTMIWLLPAILIGLISAELRNRRHLRRLAPDHSCGLTSRLHLLPDLLALVALALILFPLQPSRLATVESTSGPTIALVIDVSTSMGATDLKPSRLGQAKQELIALMDQFPGARYSLIPFAGEAVLQVPLTGDREGLRFFIDKLHPGLIDSPGSAPEEAVLLAQTNLAKTIGERLVILISDGERTIAEQPPQLSDSIPVYSVLTGTTRGGQVGRAQSAISKADPKRLVSISRQTGGRFLKDSTNAPTLFDLPLASIPTDSADLSPTRLAIIIALILLVLRWAPTIVPFGRILSVSLLLTALLFPGCDTNTPSIQPRAQFRHGLQAAQNQQTDRALRDFSSAAKMLDGTQRGAALYNQATLLLETGQIEDAITLFEQALILIPGDKAIRENLLLALSQQKTVSDKGKSQSKPMDTGDGEELTPEQAQRLVDSVQLDPTAPFSEQTVRQPTVLKEW